MPWRCKVQHLRVGRFRGRSGRTTPCRDVPGTAKVVEKHVNTA